MGLSNVVLSGKELKQLALVQCVCGNFLLANEAIMVLLSTHTHILLYLQHSILA